MDQEEFEEVRAAIYEHARDIRENGEYADNEDAADCYTEWALDQLYDEYYGY